jgi:phosphoadenosine phosphosulfate reductase
LDSRVRRSLAVIKYAERRSPRPLVVNFSGGRDSLVLLDLVQRVTENFICCFCVTGIEFPEALEAVKNTAEERGIDLFISHPTYHKGGFFQRLAQFREFPTIKQPWCSRDLKHRPQKKLLDRIFGNSIFYKLNAVRRQESIRRRRIYRKIHYMMQDFDVSRDIMVFPIMDWTNLERDRYIQKRGLRVETNPLYEQYGVSGCFWCPFYQPDIYRRILAHNIELYDSFIEWEKRLGSPSVIGYTWLRDLKEKVLNGDG